jgi:hypothetical protein
VHATRITRSTARRALAALLIVLAAASTAGCPIEPTDRPGHNSRRL